MKVKIPPTKGAILEVIVPLKSIGSFSRGVCSKTNRSVLNYGMTTRLQQATAMLPTDRCHITLSLDKFVSVMKSFVKIL